MGSNQNQNQSIGIESVDQSESEPATSVAPETAAGADGEDALEIEISVAGETFETMEDARAYVRQQEEQEFIEDVRAELMDVLGDDAADRIVETVSPDGERMSFESVAQHMFESSTLNISAEGSVRVATGALIQEFGKQYANNSFKFE